MRVLVTGGAGFIGSNYVRKIVTGQLPGVSSVIVLDKLTYAGVIENLDSISSSPNYKFIQGDICNQELINELINEVDAVINFAAESHVDRSIEKSDQFVISNILGVQVLLEAVKNSKKCIRFLQISTDEVYGSIEKGSWDEYSPIAPNSPYSASKAGGDLLAQSYFKTHKLDVLITRCSNNYGAFQFPEKIIPLFVTNLLENKKVSIYGDGKNIRDWLHVDDHCRGIHAVLFRGESGNVYNIGGGEELTNLELTEIILTEFGKDKSQISFIEDRKGHDFRYSINWEKMNSKLGYIPEVKFSEGIRETIEWYKNNEKWWKALKK